jgi:hypothetical protein
MNALRVFSLALGLGLLISTHAAGSMPPPATFDVLPAVTDWSTISSVSVPGGGIPGQAETIVEQAALDAAVQLLSATAISDLLPATATNPPSTNGAARWNSTLQLLQTRPTGNAAAVVMKTLHNDTGHYITNLLVTYDSSSANIFPSELPGHSVYYSTTGLPNSWSWIGTLGLTDGPAQFTVTNLEASFGNNPLYLLWVDDNGTGTDGSYMIDNVSVLPQLGPVVPEPTSACLIISGMYIVPWLLRRKQRSTTSSATA